MKVKKMDIVVAILASLTCFTLLFGFPVWALFIGWGWYYVLGAKPSAFKQAIPPMLLGYVCAAASIIGYAQTGDNIFVLALIVGITNLVIMLSLRIKIFDCSLAAFNAYSCMFAGYYAVSFPQLGDSFIDIKNILICILWLAIANISGLFVGYLSIELSKPFRKKLNK